MTQYVSNRVQYILANHMQQYLKCSWLKYVYIHFPNMNVRTRNV